MTTDLRSNIWAKCIATVLVLALSLGCAAGVLVLALLADGWGTADSYEEDQLFDETMRSAMYCAYDYMGNDSSYVARVYSGFSARAYRGDPADGQEFWTMGAPPRDGDSAYIRREMTKPVDDTDRGQAEDTDIGYCTIVGYYRWEDVKQGSVFENTAKIFRTIHQIRSPSLLIVLLVLMGGCALALVIFLCCASGHRKGREGVVPNLYDRIPLDVLCVAVPIGVVLCGILVSDVGYRLGYGLFHFTGYEFSLMLAAVAAGFLGIVILVLSSLLTLCTRFKLGKWWRNSVCWWVLSLCWRVLQWVGKKWKRFRRGMGEFFRSLPMTWRTVAVTGGVFALHGILVILLLAFRYDVEIPLFFGFLIFLMDLALIIGSGAVALQLSKVKDLGAALAAGDLEAKLDTQKLLPDLRTHAEHLNAIGVGMNKAVEQRMKSERLKTELITNVSHDIKTPLTSIINYVDLLKKEELTGTAAEYLAVLDRQSRRLKKLTEDLVEASKASTGNMAVHLEAINVNELVHQAIADYDQKLSAGRLEVIINSYEGNLSAMADGRLLWRVLDNLLGNICKYAMAGTRVYVDLGVRENRVFLSLKNISRDPLNVSADELMERFVRGDASRHTEGSGLGLNIAKSLMDLMHGTFSLSVDGDLFKAEMTLPSPTAAGAGAYAPAGPFAAGTPAEAAAAFPAGTPAAETAAIPAGKPAPPPFIDAVWKRVKAKSNR